MATVTVTASAFCSGNGHFTLTATGAKSGSWRFETTEILGFTPTTEEIRQAMKVLLSIGVGAKTAGQAKTWLLAGVDIALTA